MTNFEKIENMPLKFVFNKYGFQEQDVQMNVFMNMFQLINCNYCPTQEDCRRRGEYCQIALKRWLESEAKNEY